MTGEEFRAARLRLDLSFREMAKALGLSAEAGRRAVRRYELEGPPPAVAERTRQLLAGGRDGHPREGDA